MLGFRCLCVGQLGEQILCLINNFALFNEIKMKAKNGPKIQNWFLLKFVRLESTELGYQSFIYINSD